MLLGPRRWCSGCKQEGWKAGEEVSGVVRTASWGVHAKSRALLDRTLKSTRSHGRIDCIEAKDRAKAI
jgi:hypothetical protein